jgi:transcriptional regulator with XRE-family HTH domain
MTIPASTIDPGSLVVMTDRSSHVMSSAVGIVTIGRDAQATVQIDDPRISRVHVRAEFVDGGWRVVDTSKNGMYVGDSRADVVPVTQGLTVRLGDPTEGPAVRFELTPTNTSFDRRADDSGFTRAVQPDGADDDDTTVVDSGMARAGFAAAARRRELDISQRSLAADGIINAGALISFEKGRSWPRDKTRAKLEEVLRWPPGTINQLRAGGPAGDDDRTEVVRREQVGDEGSLIAEAVLAAVNTLGSTIDALPAVDHPEFTPRITAILSDLRQLEAVAARATRIGKVTPALIRALSTVRRRMDELTMLGATAQRATLGQRLYAARRNANLTIVETAQAAGVAEDVIMRAESEQPVPASAVGAIEALIGHLDWR